jgi:GT2 family glycosyltransferase
MSHTLYIVTGMHRSGTSLVARMLEVYGITIPGELVGPAPDNEKGFFEDKAIVSLNDELLRALDLRWDSLHGFFLKPSEFSHPRFSPFKKRAEELIRARVSLDEDWAFKDPRISRLGGFWLPLLSAANIDYKFVIAVRDPTEVVGSLQKRNAFGHLKSLYLWLFYYLDLLDASRDCERIVLHYDQVVLNPREMLGLVSSFFLEPGKLIEAGAVAEFSDEFVSDKLRHHEGMASSQRLAWVESLYQLFLEEVSAPGVFSPGARLDALIQSVRGSTVLLDLLALASQTEQNKDRLYEEQRVELTTIVEDQRSDITEFKAYQSKLERDLKEQVNWSEKLAADIKTVNSETKAQIEALHSELSQVQSSRTLESLTHEKLKQELDSLAEATEKEARRLWEIIEKYRLEVERLEGSISWRVTHPFRVVSRAVRRTPELLWLGIKKSLSWLVFLLPPFLRHRIVKVVERGRLVLSGEVDNHSIRASHEEIISQRSKLLCPKPVLDHDALPEMDISIVTFNSEKWIDQFALSVRAQDYPLGKICLTIVDNGSNDDTVDKLRTADFGDLKQFQVIESSNGGYGTGHNQAIAAGTNELVLVTNIDLEFRGDSLTRAISFAVQDEPDVGSWELRQAPYEHPKFYDPVTLQTAWSSHACIVIRREAFESVGGYEERIFMYGEDVELSYRLRSSGCRLRYLPSAVVDHYTYQEPGEVKLLQYEGSTLANAYIRMRYGSLADVLGVLPLYSRLAAGSSGVADNLDVVKRNGVKIARNASYFLRKRSETGRFSFRGWDYDIVRDGAFYESGFLPVKRPKISVVTRTYNGRHRLLVQCLQSVAHQTYTNIEHVIVEDGGNSLATTVEEFRDAYPESNIVYSPLDKVGRCHAGNSGLEMATGEYLMFLDDDDLLFCDHVEVCLAELCSNDDLGAVYALAWEVETEFDEAGGYEEMSHGIPASLRQEFDREVLLHHNYIPIQSIVFRRSLYDELGGFDPELENLEDWNLWVRYAARQDFKMIEKTTSMYRTPWDLGEKARRQSILDEYLPVAKAKNQASMEEGSSF